METAAIIIIIAAVDFFIKFGGPGFSGLLFTPYIVASLICAVIYDRVSGFTALLISAAAAFIQISINGEPFSDSITGYAFPAATGLVLIYIFGTLRANDRRKMQEIKNRHRELAAENQRLKSLSDAQFEITRELEQRISGQRVSLSSLYNQMHRMDSLNLNKSLDILLETVEMFTETTSASIWAPSNVPGFLSPAASRSKSGKIDNSEFLDMENSIEGWVFRNNRMVSVRMINNFEHLSKMDAGENIITLPISIQKKVWGVLNIEEMPFIKYNSYTEKILEIIISLAEPALARAVNYEKQSQQNEIDKTTGLPLFSQLYNMLEKYKPEAGEEPPKVSLLIVEIANYQQLFESFKKKKLWNVFTDFINEIQLLAAGMAEFFMFKSENQFAALIPGVSSDGASLLCLEILEMANNGLGEIDGRAVQPELLIGYATLGDNASDTEELIKEAEHILEIQKI